MTDDAVTKSSRPNEKVGFAWTGTGVNTFFDTLSTRSKCRCYVCVSLLEFSVPSVPKTTSDFKKRLAMTIRRYARASREEGGPEVVKSSQGNTEGGDNMK